MLITLAFVSLLQVVTTQPAPGVQPPTTNPVVTRPSSAIQMPPSRGRAEARSSRGSRSDAAKVPNLWALAPSDAGLTLSTTPSLLFVVETDAPLVTRFTIVLDEDTDEADTPVLRVDLSPNTRAGVHAVHLRDHNIQLRPASRYRWTVQLLDPSKPGVAGQVAFAGASLFVVPADQAAAAGLSPEMLAAMSNSDRHAAMIGQRIIYDLLAESAADREALLGALEPLGISNFPALRETLRR